MYGQIEVGVHDFRKPNNTIYVIAHRGAHHGIPENSLPAYQKAIDLGCDFVEIDIRTTKDGKFVSMHNSTIDNYVDDKTGTVKNMTLAELKSLNIGEKIGEEWKKTQIPTLEEILQLCKGKIGIYLDLKDAPIPELMAIIRKYDMENDIIWYIPYQHLMEIENVEHLFGNSFPMPDPGDEKNIKSVLEKIKTPVIATDMSVLTRNFVVESHRYNAKVFVDEKHGDISEWQKIIDWGTDGIQTDKPEELIKYLKKKQNSIQK
jgi:glycerophosphoryl diester phosphodiesterase